MNGSCRLACAQSAAFHRPRADSESLQVHIRPGSVGTAGVPSAEVPHVSGSHRQVGNAPGHKVAQGDQLPAYTCV